MPFYLLQKQAAPSDKNRPTYSSRPIQISFQLEIAAHQFSDQETAQNEETTMMPPLSTNNRRINLQLLQ